MNKFNYAIIKNFHSQQIQQKEKMKRLPTTPQSTLSPKNLGIQRKREREGESKRGGRGLEHPVTFILRMGKYKGVIPNKGCQSPTIMMQSVRE